MQPGYTNRTIIKPLFQKEFFITVLMALVLTACATPRTPQEVAQGFWDAAIAQNVGGLQTFSRATGSPVSDTQLSQLQDVTISLGKLHLQNRDAWIDTEAQLNKNGQAVTFKTILVKENNEWRVDPQQTINNVETRRKEMASKQSPAEKLVKKLHTLGDRFAKDMDKATTELKQQLPEIEKQIQSLGKNMGEEVEQAWKKFGPELEKNLHEFADAISRAIENAKKKSEKQDSPVPDPTLKTI